VILVAPNYANPLVRIAASGGERTTVVENNYRETQMSFYSPVWLGGDRFLVAKVAYHEDRVADAGVYLGTVGSPDLTRVVAGRVDELAVDSGELIIRRGSDLIAQTFDADTGVLSGTPRRIATDARSACDAAHDVRFGRGAGAGDPRRLPLRPGARRRRRCLR
jgi:hypothetical protein